MIIHHSNERRIYYGGPDDGGRYEGDYAHTITVLPHVKARTPRYIGAEIEYQDYADEVNLWDFVKDAGIQMTRSRSFDARAHDIGSEAYPYEKYVHDIRSRADFENWKKEFLKAPSDFIHPNSYNFNLKVPHEGGTPDKSVEHILAAGAVPCIQMKWAQSPEKPLVKEWHLIENSFPDDSKIDWEVFANAYLHFFTVIHHFTGKFGCTYYMLDNEPAPGRQYPNPQLPYPEGMDSKTCDRIQFCNQLSVLCCAARTAMEDIKARLNDSKTAEALFLSGYAVFGWSEEVGLASQQYIDAVDFHHYGRRDDVYARRFKGLQKLFPDNKIFCSEFNVRGGPVHPDASFFAVSPCLEFGSLLMEVLGTSDPDFPGLESAMMYQFSYPATHRTFKSLVYGDLNTADMFSVFPRKKKIVERPKEWQPTLQESQLRFETMAYQIYRMLARCVPGGQKKSGNAVLETLDSCFSSDREMLINEVKTMAVQSDENLYINFLNPDGEFLRAPLEFDLSRLDKKYRYAVRRLTARLHEGEWADDRVISVEEIKDGKITVPQVFGESFNQIILTNRPLDRIEKIELREETVTPGNVKDNLKLYQTTILVPYGLLDGAYVDLSALNILWESTEPDLVCAYQSGLIQRVRSTKRSVTVKASLFDRPDISASVTFPGDLQD